MMSDSVVGERMPVADSGAVDVGRRRVGGGGAELPQAARYAASLLFVALATGFALIVEDRVGAPNLTLIFVLPVIAAATAFGWGPSLIATVASVLAFDFFFTEPKYSLAIAGASDAWAAALLLVIAAIVSGVAAESRRRQLSAQRAAEQAQALQTLAHAVIQAGPYPEILAAAATALNQIFRAPSVIFMQQGPAFGPVATAGGARITPAEEEAALGARDSGLRTRAEHYPFLESEFDFWPVASSEDRRWVLGVSFMNSGRSRPAAPDRFVEIVGAYLAAASLAPVEAGGPLGRRPASVSHGASRSPG
jgi:K+-sensing histidine kinase KdpD